MRCEDWRAVLALALILAHSADAFLAPMPLAPRRPMPGASHRIVCSLRAAASVPHAKRWRGPRAEEEAGGEVCWCCLFASRMGQAAALPRRIALYVRVHSRRVRRLSPRHPSSSSLSLQPPGCRHGHRYRVQARCRREAFSCPRVARRRPAVSHGESWAPREPCVRGADSRVSWGACPAAESGGGTRMC